MNATTSPATPADALLTLILPPPLADPVSDWLLEQHEITGFVSLPVNGHGGAEHGMSAAEKVAGYRRGWMIQTHLPEPSAQALLERLRETFAGSDIHFWLAPLSACGHLG